MLVPFFISLAIEEAYWAAPKIPRLVFDAIPPDDTALRYLEVTSEEALLEQLNEASSKGRWSMCLQLFFFLSVVVL